MDSGLLLASISTLSCVALGLAVGLRRERSVIARAALALLLATALWSGGLGFASWQGPGAVAALRIAALGTFSATALWLLLALRQRWPLRFRSSAAMAIALVPAWLFVAAALTNESHGLAFRLDAGAAGADWAGPLTRILFAWAFGCVAAGAALFTESAVRLWREGERRSGLVLLLVMPAQPILYFVDLRGAVEPAYPLAAASLTVAALVLATTLLRYSLLQPPPLGHRQVIEHLRHGVLMANAAGEVLDHNAAAERLLGGAPGGHSIADAIAALVPSAQRAPIHSALERVADTLEPVFLQVGADRHRHLEVSVRSIPGDHGSSIGQVAMLRDRTAERGFAEAALRTQKLEAVGTLAAGVAHEVNNPLAFVRANLGEIVRLAELTLAWRTKHESALADALAEMGELAHEALTGLSRIQRAVADVRRLAAAPDAGVSAVSLDAVVLDAVRLLELRGSGRVEIRTHFAPELPAILGSPQLLVQAVLSLLLNSQQALEDTPDPWIEVDTGASAESEVWVRVRDNGPAIPAALRDRIHEPYLLTARDPSGRDLGTSLAAGIARDHGGALDAEPRDDGAAFVLRLAARSER
jgi:nitrogen-specific signal transduction histidine kinase